MMKKTIFFFLLISALFLAQVHSGEAGQPAGGEEHAVTQWCQCVRGLLDADWGDYAGCIGRGTAEDKESSERRVTWTKHILPVSKILTFTDCNISELAREKKDLAPVITTGTLSFDVSWQGAPREATDVGSGPAVTGAERASAREDCEAAGISAVVATVYSPDRVKLASGGPWKCSDKAGRINNVPAGQGLRLVITGKDPAGNALYRGARFRITLAAGRTKALGTITATPFTPAPAAPENAAKLADGLVSFSWTKAAGASYYRIQVSKDPAFASKTINTAVAASQYKPKRALASRGYYWRIKAVDAYKNAGKWSPPWGVMVDAEAPANTTAGTFINSGQAMTNSAVVSLVISATDNNGVAAYHVSENAMKPEAHDAGWVSVPPAASYAADIPFTLSGGDGEKTVSVAFKDELGNVSQARGGAIIYDTTLPDTLITNRPAELTNSTSAAFSFASTKEASTFACSLDGSELSACEAAMTYEGLAEGPHTLNVTATDAAGNVDPVPATCAWTIDTTPPDTAITTRPRIWTNLTSAEFGFSSAEPGATFQCRLDDAAFADCVSPLDYKKLAAGQHTFAVMATDAAGNVDPAPPSYAWTIDTTPFGTAITDKPSKRSNVAAAGFSFTARKTDVTFQCKLDIGDYSACASAMTYTGLAEGSHAFHVKAVDALGNEDTLPAGYTWVVSLPPINTTPLGFINMGGAYLTHKSPAKLHLSASAMTDKTITGYCASETPDEPDESDPCWVTVASAKAYARDVPYTLSDGMGVKTVYVWFRDSEGNISEMKFDTIYAFNSTYAAVAFFMWQVATVLVL